MNNITRTYFVVIILLSYIVTLICYAHEAWTLTVFFAFIGAILIAIYSVLQNKCDDELLTEEEIRLILQNREDDSSDK